MIATTHPSVPSVLSPSSGPTRVPKLFQSLPEGGKRFWEFFTVNISNPHPALGPDPIDRL